MYVFQNGYIINRILSQIKDSWQLFFDYRNYIFFIFQFRYIQRHLFNTDISGYAGGSYYDHLGAAADYLCLPPDPNYRKTTYSGQHGEVYGGEYDSPFVPNGDGNDVPCAVCRRNGVSTILMIPGKDTCYKGWNREYYGYLNAHHYSFRAATSFVCLHVYPQFVAGGSRNYEGKLFQPVVGICGALQCPPYVNNYPLTCVVCTK